MPFRGSCTGIYRAGMFEYDIALGIWTDRSSPSAGKTPFVSSSTALAHWNGKLYVFGGYDGIVLRPPFLILNPRASVLRRSLACSTLFRYSAQYLRIVPQNR